MIEIYTSIHLKFEKIQYPIIIIRRAPRFIHKHAIMSKVHGVTLYLTFYSNNNNIENNNMEFLQMSNRVISNTTGLLDTFTPSIRPRYRAFNETHYASVPVPLSCYSNYTFFHGIPVSASTFAQVPTTNFNNVVVDQHSYHPQHY